MPLPHRLFVLLGALLALCAAPSLADPSDIAAAGRGVVRVVIVKPNGGPGAGQSQLVAHGSGFAISQNLVVTNAHVVDPLHQDNSLIAGVVPSEGKGGVSAHVIAFSPGNDLALLRLDGQAQLPALALYTGAVQDGAEVYAVGYPGNVDLAQGLSLAELVQPQEPVKTRGYVSSGRSSKQFDTLLHTAPIGSGNSGGPLLDACGRVVGVNSFGTVSDNGTDSAFYFAISMRELTRFLQQALGQNQGQNQAQTQNQNHGQNQPLALPLGQGIGHTTDLPCTSIADLDKAESERAAGDQARQAADLQARATARQVALEQARRKAELDVLAERDNGMAIAALLLVATIGAGAAAFLFAQRGQTRYLRVAASLAVVLLLAAIVAWLLRPSLQTIDNRAENGTPAPADGASASATPAGISGRLICVFDPQRSRVTISDTSDVPIEWNADGCADRKTQYGMASDGWTKVDVPDGDDAVTVTHFDPDTATLTRERYLLPLDVLAKARAGRDKISTPACGSGDSAAQTFGQAQGALRALLPTEPNERMRYRCQLAH